MILGLQPGEFAALMALFFAGSIVLVPVLALSARLALKPLIDTLRLRSSGDADVLQDRRIALLEAEVQHLSAALHQMAEDDFRRQLGSPTVFPLEHHA